MIHDGVRLQDLVNKMVELLSENFYLRACCMLYAGFMLSLLLNPEERGAKSQPNSTGLHGAV